jgi:hypothetical protein
MVVQRSALCAEDAMLGGSFATRKGQVSLAGFQECVSALERQTMTIKSENLRRLSQLSDDFRFPDSLAQISRF